MWLFTQFHFQAADFWTGSGLFLCIQTVACSIPTLCWEAMKSMCSWEQPAVPRRCLPALQPGREGGRTVFAALEDYMGRDSFCPHAYANICERAVIIWTSIPNCFFTKSMLASKMSLI